MIPASKFDITATIFKRKQYLKFVAKLAIIMLHSNIKSTANHDYICGLQNRKNLCIFWHKKNVPAVTCISEI